MSDTITGGCLCGAVRYQARGEPRFAGYCCCDDCQKQSGSGFIPFMGFSASAIAITGDAMTHSLPLSDGRVSDRNHCARCGSLVFGGVRGRDEFHTVYAGTLDDLSQFKPKMAINTRFKPDWVILPPGLAVFEGMPGK